MTNASRFYRIRRVTWRSHRKTRAILFVCGVIAGVLGGGLIGIFWTGRNTGIATLGVLYVLAAILMLGIRAILGYVDEQNRRRRSRRRSDRMVPNE